MTDDKPARQLTAAEIVRELRRLRYDPANGRGKARVVPIKWVAELAGVNRATLYRIICDGRVSDNTRVALSLGRALLYRLDRWTGSVMWCRRHGLPGLTTPTKLYCEERR